MVFERLGPAFTGLERSTGVPANQWADHIGGETVGYVINMLFNAFSPKTAMNVLGKIIIGLGTALAGAFAAGIGADDRRALVQWGTTNILGAIDTLIDPEGFSRVSQSFNQFISQLSSGDILGAFASQFGMPATYVPPPPPMQYVPPPQMPQVTPPQMPQMPTPTPGPGTVY